VVAGAWPLPYSVHDDVISDLGNTACGSFSVPHGVPYPVCSPLHGLMNASFVTAGVLTVLGAVLLRNWWPRGGAGTTSWWLWLVVGVGKVIVGLVPENTDIGLHVLGALNIPLGSVAILVFSAAVRHRARGLALTGVVLGVVGLVGSLLSVAGQYAGPGLYLGLGAGGAERLGGYPGNLWMVVIGMAAVLGAPPWCSRLGGERAA
jgi:hypothetical membrane protein